MKKKRRTPQPHERVGMRVLVKVDPEGVLLKFIDEMVLTLWALQTVEEMVEGEFGLLLKMTSSALELVVAGMPDEAAKANEMRWMELFAARLGDDLARSEPISYADLQAQEAMRQRGDGPPEA